MPCLEWVTKENTEVNLQLNPGKEKQKQQQEKF